MKKLLKSPFLISCVAINTTNLVLALILHNYLAAMWIISATYWLAKSENLFNELMEEKKERIKLMIENTGLCDQNMILLEKIKNHIENADKPE